MNIEKKTIKIVQSLRINCQPDHQLDVRNALIDATNENACSNPALKGFDWYHNVEAEERRKKYLRDPNEDMIVFSRRTYDLRTLSFGLVSEGNCSYLVGLEPGIDPFELDETNSFLDSFVQDIVERAALKVNLEVIRGRRQCPLDAYIPEKSANIFAQIFATADRGASLDTPLVRDLLLDAYMICLEISYNFDDFRLFHWAFEVEKWPRDIAYNFNLEFCRSLELLKAYNRRKGHDTDAGIARDG
jgi:hypothetical protein